MIKPAVALVLTAALLAGACSRDTPTAETQPAGPATPHPLGPAPDYDGENLLSLAHGASVVDRTGEFSFESAAVHAIDGDAGTVWSSPPGALDQTLTFGLGALTRIDTIGAVARGDAPDKLRFETSTDGQRWQPLAEQSIQPAETPQKLSVAPRDALYVRVHTLAADQRFAVLASVQLSGKELGKPHQADIAGCWTINGRPARFERDGARVYGVVDADRPTYVDGGSNGRAIRTMWVDGPNRGYALLTVSPDGQSMSGTRWHETVETVTTGAGWIGRRGPCPAAGINTAIVRDRFMEKGKRYSLYGLRFDERDQLVGDASHRAIAELATTLTYPSPQTFRIVAHEFTDASRVKNSTRAAARLEALRAALLSRGVPVERLEFVSRGSESDGREAITLPQKLMIGSVDLERVTR